MDYFKENSALFLREKHQHLKIQVFLNLNQHYSTYYC